MTILQKLWCCITPQVLVLLTKYNFVGILQFPRRTQFFSTLSRRYGAWKFEFQALNCWSVCSCLRRVLTGSWTQQVQLHVVNCWSGRIHSEWVNDLFSNPDAALELELVLECSTEPATAFYFMTHRVLHQSSWKSINNMKIKKHPPLDSYCCVPRIFHY